MTSKVRGAGGERETDRWREKAMERDGQRARARQRVSERERRRPGDFVGAHAYYRKMLGRGGGGGAQVCCGCDE